MVKKGKMRLIVGPMYSGKSSELQRMLRRYKIAGKKVLCVNHANNNRYGNSDLLQTHDKIYMDGATNVFFLASIFEMNLDEFTIIGIDEAQFFSDLEDACNKLLSMGKRVLVAGLDSDYNRKPFTNVLNLIPMANSVIKLTSICIKCGEKAIYTEKKIKHENTTNEKRIEVGGEDMYQAKCSNCFGESSIQKT